MGMGVFLALVFSHYLGGGGLALFAPLETVHREICCMFACHVCWLLWPAVLV